ncbi:kinase-like domain-containing protein [Pseudomassariella vexata]|uniref:Kinase-like domain-containing protein n=1 Tax=Pseudomassariella vexata TaxID=1141098 RepID=A0A1Y2DIY5_9PEZI|nr:kinase-like domain-containing protein [Pseudomassariella vexata]ORY58785.1 kinase-like domain-containing protein [Pseudomassariella vexata]
MMLEKFNGSIHPHIITVLSTFKYRGKYHLLFPWAECDLQQYWNTRPEAPPKDRGNLLWISEQCHQIMEAVHKIHEPPSLGTLNVEEERWGRHGDIKAENILVFKSPKGKYILVISDLGLGALHRQISRSNVPNQSLPTTPAFRPPECDMKDGKISRAFDVWTLGCLFLDMIIWYLGGEPLRKQFEKARMTRYINDEETDIYFDIGKDKNGETAFRVKLEVTKWLAEMHCHKACSQYLHEFLDLIERKMLVVETKKDKRAKAGYLAQEMRDMHRKCKTDLDYGLKEVPKPSLVTREPLVVTEHLAPTAQESVRKHNVTLSRWAGEPQQAEHSHDDNED